MKAMNRIFVYLVLAWAMALVPVSSAYAVVIELDPSQTEIGQGDVFSIDVVANGVFEGLDLLDEVLAFGFDVTVSDASVVRLLGATVASPFDDDSGLFPDTDVAGSAFPGIANDGASDRLLLATLIFESLTKGVTSVGIQSDLSDFNEGLIYFLSSPVDISTSMLVTVPEPASYWLLFAALAAGLAGRARRVRALV